jgi:FkbM family methyltransferase
MFAPQSPDGVLETLQREKAATPDFYMIDVGVSGGIHPVWRRWGARLNAIGIDALDREVERLRREETNPKVIYDAVKVRSPAAASDQGGGNYQLHRSQAYMGTALLAEPESPQNYRRRWHETVSGARYAPPVEANFSNLPDPLADPFYRHYQRLFQKSIGLDSLSYAADSATVDEIAARHGWTQADLIKIDTDGFDRDVLTSAANLLTRCLAVEIEVQFHGLAADGANVFSEVDRYLRPRGYNLAKLEPYTYGRSALPRRFVYPDLPAQTEGGPIQWADALYIRDPLRPGAADFDRRQLLVLAGILDTYGLEDYAAEIILAYPEAFAGIDGRLLDGLARKIHGPGYSYDRVIAEFIGGVAGYRRP